MKMLIWLTQLGLSVALPLTGFVLLGNWLHRSLGWGAWTVPAGLVIGLICAVQGFRDAVKAMDRMSRDRSEPEPPPSCYNHHD